MMKRLTILMLLLSICALPASGWTWHDETHLAIAKVAGYKKWYNTAGADIAKIKAGDVENKNHHVNNPPGAGVTPEMVLNQVAFYNNHDDVLDNLSKIEIYPIEIQSEEDLAKEVAQIADVSMNLGYKLEWEDRLLSKEEAYQQVSHSASLARRI